MCSLQEPVEILVQLLLGGFQFVFCFFCPGFVISQIVFGHLNHFVQFFRLGSAFDFSVGIQGGP